MTLHLGGDVIISMKDVIAIFDLGTSKTSETNNEFLEIAKEEGFINRISDDTPKTFVLAELDRKTVIFLSPISSSTLLKRTEFISNISSSYSLVEQGEHNGKK